MKKLLSLGVALFVTVAIFAVPAKTGVKKMVQLTDGTTVELSLCGDEHYSFLRDIKGNPYQLNADGRAMRISYEQVAERWASSKKARMAKAAVSGVGRRASANRIGKS